MKGLIAECSEGEYMQMKYDRCPNCMQELSGSEATCPYCGFEIEKYEERTTCLRPFTVLQNKYMLGRVIGVGGFGITYIGWDLNLQTYIAIKEYFPESMAGRDTSGENGSTVVIPHDAQKDTYDKGLKRYVEEAQNLSKFYQLQGIVSVKDFFYENGTAYIVMEYINGINLKEYLNNAGGKLPEATVLALMKPVLESLYQIHNSGLVHRDISPDNIMVTNDGKIKLIDFGSARGQSGESEKTYTVILKHGYAPPEQYYARGNQGPWTDIYSLCAAMYKMLTGQIPPNSVERMESDEYAAPSTWGVPVSPRTEAVLAKGLAVKVSDRYQNMGQLLNDLYGTQPIETIGAAAATPTPNTGGTSFANPASMSQQSMYLSMQPEPAKPQSGNGDKKKLFIVLGAAAAIVIIAIVIVLALGKGSGRDKTTDTEDPGNPSVTDTEEPPATDTEEPAPSTEGTDPQTPGGYSYVWPTELSDDWHDYMISIDGTIYQFPMPYSEWKSMGWKSNALPTNLAAGDYSFVDFYSDKMELRAVLMNYGLNEATVDESFVIGISIDSHYNNVSDDVVIELPGGLKMFEADEATVKQTYGAPDYRSDSDYVSLDYVGDTYLDGMDIEFRDGTITSVSLVNSQQPEGLAVSVSDIETAPPSINASYVAPENASTDRFDSILTVDGVNYRLPVPVSEFTANGWTLDSATDDYILGSSSITTELQKGGNKISVTLENYTSNAILPINAYITSIEADMDYCDFEVIFPGGIKLGDSNSVFESTYSDLGDDNYSRDDYSSFIAYYVTQSDYDAGDMIRISVYADPETGVLDKYEYSHRVSSIQ